MMVSFFLAFKLHDSRKGDREGDYQDHVVECTMKIQLILLIVHSLRRLM